ncbi:hypothetical protein MM213_14890 [Belliella sp. R4-6]|uniref:Lipoprotein n=1 Tax=Belliella alkalica TaxID=1730871 RepID=A0ABS9VEB2_9BACT|nr:hypothetical protein [Belliella alkalica]MCH7414785.1 hypothetical protein [Belliella alkalica]
MKILINYIIRNFILLSFLASVFFSCKDPVPHDVDFYYWKSEFKIEKSEKETFGSLNSKKLYVRLFDVDKEGSSPNPKGVIDSFRTDALDAEYIPVVFITNRVFSGLTEVENQQLAKDVWSLINKLISTNSQAQFREIQIDCDWTSSTKDSFFSFLSTLKTVSQKEVTSTLRLHQVKYKESTGVPPVDKVYLMAYATSDPIEDSDLNSILDIELLKDYLQTINEYPLKFDIALPLYSWGIISNHLGKKKLINGVSHEHLESHEYLKLNANTYEVLEDVFLRGIWLNKGFLIKVETITPELLKETKNYLSNKINHPYHIVYYHLDSIFTQRFSMDDLK